MIEHQYVETNGIRLHVASAGPRTGPLLIFLHGFPEFWYGWRKQIEHFAAQGYWVLAPDQRGYNLSDKPEGIQSYAIDRLADDVAGLIGWAGRKKAALVGHDWGAAVAWWTAVRHPELLEKLVILNVPHPSVMKRNLTSNPRQLRKSWYIFFFQIPRLPELYLGLDHSKKLAASLRGTSRPGTFSDEDLIEYRKAWAVPGAVESMLHWYRASLRYAGRAKGRPTVSTPTLVIWGEKDPFLGKEMASQSLEYCERGRLELIPTATHWVQHEEPERVNRLIGEFLRES